MTDTIKIGEISITFVRKRVKHTHLTVHPPAGRVTLVAPVGTRLEVARAFAISKLGWLRDHRAKLAGQSRETDRQFVERESHFFWGRRYLLSVQEKDEKPSVVVAPQWITLTVRPGTPSSKRAEIMADWQRQQLRIVVQTLIKKWESKFGVRVKKFFVQRMKTKWGACNHQARTLRFNTELVKKPADLVEYIVIHEIAHLLEPKHSERFVAILKRHFSAWREARAEINGLPLAAEVWRE